MAFACPAVAQTAGTAEMARPDIPSLLQELKSDDPSIWRKAQADILREWSSSGSSSMDLLLERGRKALEHDNTDAAIDHLTALIDHAPDFAEGYNMRAMAYYEAGLFGPALADLGHALQLNPHQFGALAGLGMILEDSGFDKPALAAYKASAAIDPHQPSVNQAIARLTRKAEGEEI
ncbi:MAG: hypothetical protein PF443_13760 [Allgaiera sp.]|nr:hypothetical protein [Allgaiera sp.]